MADKGLVNMEDNPVLAALKAMLGTAQKPKTDAAAADAIDPVITSSGTASGYAEGGEVSPSQNFDFERSDQYPTAAMTGSDIPNALMAYLGVPAAAKAGEAAVPEAMGAMQRLGEAGEISIGKAAPKMEGMGSKIEVFSKGVMGKGTPNETTIWGVKGPAEEVSKLGYGPDPGSIPEHILKQHGLLPEAKISIPGQNAPNGYADGGEVMPQPFPAGGYPGAGEENANSVLDMMKTMGLRSMLPGSDMMNNMASGIGQAVTDPSTAGVINSQLGTNLQNAPQPPQGDPAFMAKLQAGTAMTPPAAPAPQHPPLAQAAQNAQNMPPTDYSLYKGISADDRANLYKQLLAQKASPGGLAASGVAGLGDAISNAFGKGGQHAQQDVRQAQQQNVGNVIGGMDTQRQQKLQDIQGSIALQEADPNSPYSKGMRQFLNSQGMKVPSGMSAGMLKQTLPDVTKIFDTHIVAATQAGAQGLEAGKTLMGESLWQDLKASMGLAPEKAESYLESRIPGGAPQSSGGWGPVTRK